MKHLVALLLLPSLIFSQYTRDQHQHFWAGYAISQGSTLLLTTLHVKHPEVKGAGLAIFTGAMKEIADHQWHKKQFSVDPEAIKWDHWDDFTLTGSGGMVGMLLYVAVVRPILILVWPWFRKYNSEYIEWDTKRKSLYDQPVE